MQNFIYKNPTEILFGKGMIREIAGRVSQRSGRSFSLWWWFHQKQMAFMSKSRRRSKVSAWSSLGASNRTRFFETCLKAVETIKKEKIGFNSRRGRWVGPGCLKIYRGRSVFQRRGFVVHSS